jgi:hypothetical protein
VAPDAIEALAGLSTTRLTTEEPEATVAVAVSASPSEAVATTRKFPGVDPAVYRPVLSTFPPVAVHLTVGCVMEPSGWVSVAVKLCTVLGARETEVGLTETLAVRVRPRPFPFPPLMEERVSSSLLVEMLPVMPGSREVPLLGLVGSQAPELAPLSVQEMRGKPRRMVLSQVIALNRARRRDSLNVKVIGLLSLAHSLL